MFILKGIGWLLRSIWRLINFTRNFLLNLILFGLLALLLSQLIEKEPERPEIAGALNLELKGTLVEELTQAPLSELVINEIDKSGEAPKEILLSDLLWAIKSAKEDKRIKALVLQPQHLQGSLSKVQEVASAIRDFKQSGKPVFALADYYTQNAYLLAAQSDHLLLNKSGAVLIEGLGVYQLYLRQAIEKLNITPHVFKVGSYKSFVEPYTRDDMSPESREANQRWLGQLWQEYVDGVAKARNIKAEQVSPSKEQLLNLLQGVGGDTARYAKAQGLVDEILTREAMRQLLVKSIGEDEDHQWQGVDLETYLSDLDPQYGSSLDEEMPQPLTAEKEQPKSANHQIALVTAAGPIMDGVQPSGTIGGDSLAQQLAAIRFDDRYKAVVLRIDSPGGSAFAAEQIRSEIVELKKSGKPVVVSMGSVAASGGYWIAANADVIYASPTTLTGSIGVFGLFATAEKVLNSLGIHHDGVGTTDFTGLSVAKELPPHVGQVIQQGVENTYRRFIEIVAQGRNLTPAEAEAAAQGRVWSGMDAKSLGLIDEFGNLDDAIARAAKLAKLSDWRAVKIEQPQSWLEIWVRENTQAVAQVATPLLRSENQWFATLHQGVRQALTPLQRFNDPQSIYVWCNECQINPQ